MHSKFMRFYRLSSVFAVPTKTCTTKTGLQKRAYKNGPTKMCLQKRANKNVFRVLKTLSILICAFIA